MPEDADHKNKVSSVHEIILMVGQNLQSYPVVLQMLVHQIKLLALLPALDMLEGGMKSSDASN